MGLLSEWLGVSELGEKCVIDFVCGNRLQPEFEAFKHVDQLFAIKQLAGVA